MTKAVLDACVLYPAPLRDVLLSIASVGCFSPYWSDLINEEWTRSLLDNRRDLVREQITKTVETMNDKFAGANASGFETLIPSLNLPDADDRHVLALAINTQSKFIVTENLKDFPQTTLTQYEITAITPDSFIDYLFTTQNMGELIIAALAKQRRRLINPEVGIEEFILKIKQQGLTQLVQNLEAQRHNL